VASHPVQRERSSQLAGDTASITRNYAAGSPPLARVAAQATVASNLARYPRNSSRHRFSNLCREVLSRNETPRPLTDFAAKRII
jgi:hypothetical protein